VKDQNCQAVSSFEASVSVPIGLHCEDEQLASLSVGLRKRLWTFPKDGSQLILTYKPNHLKRSAGRPNIEPESKLNPGTPNRLQIILSRQRK
jgi:hypothetical protein